MGEAELNLSLEGLLQPGGPRPRALCTRGPSWAEARAERHRTPPKSLCVTANSPRSGLGANSAAGEK
eukprot:6598904-Alexandrium_andersonii.AAC.1